MSMSGFFVSRREAWRSLYRRREELEAELARVNDAIQALYDLEEPVGDLAEHEHESGAVEPPPATDNKDE